VKSLVVALTLLLAACAIDTASTTEPSTGGYPAANPVSAFPDTFPYVPLPTPEPSPELQIRQLERVRCNETIYDLQQVNNMTRQRTEVRLVRLDGAAVTIDMPTQDDYNGFSLEDAKKTQKGFEIAVEWGSRIFHHLRFNFVCRDRGFALTKVVHDTFDKHFPEDTKRYRSRTSAVHPEVPFENFVVTRYMVE
jgi:hypothetical protein